MGIVLKHITILQSEPLGGVYKEELHSTEFRTKSCSRNSFCHTEKQFMTQWISLCVISSHRHAISDYIYIKVTACDKVDGYVDLQFVLFSMYIFPIGIHIYTPR